MGCFDPLEKVLSKYLRIMFQRDRDGVVLWPLEVKDKKKQERLLLMQQAEEEEAGNIGLLANLWQKK